MIQNVSNSVSSPDFEAAAGHPDFRLLIEKMLRAIARSAKAGFAKLVSKTKGFLHYLDTKWTQAAEIDSRSRQMLEDRYTQNWHSIRGVR